MGMDACYPHTCLNPHCTGTRFWPVGTNGRALLDLADPDHALTKVISTIGWECATCLSRWFYAQVTLGMDGSRRSA